MLVEEASDRLGGNVFPRFEEAAGESGNGVGVGLNKVGHDLCKASFFVESCYLAMMIGEKGGEGVDVGGIDARDVWIRDDNERKVAEGLNAMGEANGDE